MNQIRLVILFFALGFLSTIVQAQDVDHQDSTELIELEQNAVDIISDSTGLIKLKIVDTNIVIPSLDFSGVSLRDAFTALIRAYKLSVYIDSSVTGTISMRLDNVSLNDALLFIIQEYDLEWNRTGDIVKVYRPITEPPPPLPLNIEYNNNEISSNHTTDELERFVT